MSIRLKLMALVLGVLGALLASAPSAWAQG